MRRTAPACFCNKRRGFQTNRSCLSLPTVSPGSGCESRCVRRGSGASVCAGSLGTGLTGSGGGSPIRADACLVICAEAEIATPTTPVVDLSVGIGGGHQVTPDQHHGLSPRRWHTMFILQPAPFPQCSPSQCSPSCEFAECQGVCAGPSCELEIVLSRKT